MAGSRNVKIHVSKLDEKIMMDDVDSDDSINPRTSLSVDLVRRYEDSILGYLAAGEDFNQVWKQVPEAVETDQDGVYLLTSGYHTITALKNVLNKIKQHPDEPLEERQTKLLDIDTDFEVVFKVWLSDDYDFRDTAKYYAAFSNVHGQSLAHGEKQRAAYNALSVMNLTKHDNDIVLRPHIPDRQLASMLGVSRSTVSLQRQKLIKERLGSYDHDEIYGQGMLDHLDNEIKEAQEEQASKEWTDEDDVEKKGLAKSTDVKGRKLTTPEAPVVDAVQEYLRRRISRMPYFQVSIRREYPVYMGSSKRKIDIAVCLPDDSVFVIAECKAEGKVAGGHDQLKSYLCASDAPYGFFANSLEAADWTFYKNKGQNAFKEITRSDFQKLFSDWGDTQAQQEVLNNWLEPVVDMTIELLSAKPTRAVYEQKLLEALKAKEAHPTLDQQKVYDDWRAFVSLKKRDALLTREVLIKEEQALLNALQAQCSDTQPHTIQSITDPELAIQLLMKHAMYDVIRARLRHEAINKLTCIMEEIRPSDALADLIEAVVLKIANAPNDLVEAIIDLYERLVFARVEGLDEVNRLYCKLSTAEDLDYNDADLLYLLKNAYDVIAIEIDND